MTQQLTFSQFANLLALEAEKGILNGSQIMRWLLQNKVPRTIKDIRGDIRLAVERVDDDLLVTRYVTTTSQEKLAMI